MMVSGNTDTIMVGTFDAKNHTLDIVSIPRDTLVNVSLAAQKKPTRCTDSDNIDRDARRDFQTFSDMRLTFTPWLIWRLLFSLVDAVGGVWYDVPDVEGNGQGMNYDDPAQRPVYTPVSRDTSFLRANRLLVWSDTERATPMQDIGRINITAAVP